MLAFFGAKESDGVDAEQANKIKETLWNLKKAKDQDAAVEAKKPKPIATHLRAVLESVGKDVESPIEERLLLALNTRSICFGELTTRLPVGPYRLDLAFPRVRLAVECDGKAYHSTPAQLASDQRRSDYLVALGWTVLRFTGTRIHHQLYDCVDEVCRMYERLAADQGEKEAWE